MAEGTDITVAAAGNRTLRLTEKQARVLACRVLAGDESQNEVARLAGVSSGSISLWRSWAWFAALWDDAAAHIETIVAARRSSGSLRSVSTLIDAQTDPDASTHDRIDAASKFLTLEQRRREHESEPARMELAAQLQRWARRSREILDLPAIATADEEVSAPQECNVCTTAGPEHAHTSGPADGEGVE